MAQRLQWRSGIGEQAWLAMLVETFETVSREPAKADAASIASLKVHLSRPAGAMMAGAVGLY